MATVLFHIGVLQLIVLVSAFVAEASNSSSLAINGSVVSTGGNGIATALSTNSTNTLSPTMMLKSTPLTQTEVAGTKQTLQHMQSVAVKVGLGALSSPSSTAPVGKRTSEAKLVKQNSTSVVVTGGSTGSATAGHYESEDVLPFWVYILIAFGVVFIITTMVVVMYTRLDRWKNHGSYMVWDENELELSPAFTRESEFLLDNLAADHEPGAPELQIYEIPLDSLGHQRVYIGARRIAPKNEEPKVAVRLPRRLKKKDGQHFQGNTLPRIGKRDHIYSSVNDEFSSALSEGNLCGHQTGHGHSLSAGPHKSRTLHPRDGIGKEMRFFALSSRSRSGSNLFQNRPLPPAPNKRFSRSLDRLRYFDTLSHTKSKGVTYPGNHKSPTIQPHPVLVKSSSFGGGFNKIVNESLMHPPLPPPRKGSIDFQGKSAMLPGNLRRTNLCHRHSKSLDTLLLLKELDWAAFDINIYHSYESVHSNKSGTSEKEPSYESVDSDEKPQSNSTSERVSLQSKGSETSKSPNSSCQHESDAQDEHPYASVSENGTSKTASISESVQGTTDLDNDQRSSVEESSGLLSPGSDPASPYASVRISQIPGLVSSNDCSSRGEDSGLSGDNYEPEETSYMGKEVPNSGRLSTHTYLELLPDGDNKISAEAPEKLEDYAVDRKEGRLSTHTYLELLPDTGRDSVISETSSGYARPIDILPPDKLSQFTEHVEDKGSRSEYRESLSDLKIPLGGSSTLDSSGSSVNTLESCSSNVSFQGDQEATDNFEGGIRPINSGSLENIKPSENTSVDNAGNIEKETHIYENTAFLQKVRNNESMSDQSEC